jgi:SAM-dependent methyltransferase
MTNLAVLAILTRAEKQWRNEQVVILGEHMQDWTGGYVTGIEYTSGFYRELAPTSLNFAALLRGYAPGAQDRPYNWLEIGCGNGLTANALAAANPHSQFYAFDFNPVHIQNAHRTERDAKLQNVHFFEDSFAEALERDLPQMDYIVLHGIYSWVSAGNRTHIVNIIRKFLKPGGMVYVSYNCLPGWSAKAPLRRLMTEYAARRGGPVAERVTGARDFLATLKGAGTRYLAANPAALHMADNLLTQDVSYLAHEYMNADWDLFYHSDVVNDMNGAKLTYAASATIIENIDSATLLPAAAALVNGETDPVLRELLRDYAVNQQFRRDLFIRGARKLSQKDLIDHCGSLRLCLSREREACDLKVGLPVGEATLTDEVYSPLLDALANGPRTIEELAKTTGVAFNSCLTAAAILSSLNYVQLIRDASPEAVASCANFNVAALNRAAAGEEQLVLAAARLGTGVGVNVMDQYFLHAYLSKADDPGTHVAQILRSLGRRLVSKGVAVETEDETVARLRETGAAFMENTLPIFKNFGVVQ